MYISKITVIIYDSVFLEMKMVVVNRYKTNNGIIKDQRLKKYLNRSQGYCKDFRLNRAGIFKEIPDDVTILTDYVNQIVLRTMRLHEDIILHSIYIKYPELFEY